MFYYKRWKAVNGKLKKTAQNRAPLDTATVVGRRRRAAQIRGEKSGCVSPYHLAPTR
jgi:hypothetical protein